MERKTIICTTPPMLALYVEHWEKGTLPTDAPLRLMSIEQDGSITFLDNSDGNCWVETFTSLEEGAKWCQGKLDKDECLTCIS